MLKITLGPRVWALFGGITWHLPVVGPHERNRRWRTGGLKSEDVVAAEVFKDCKIRFDVKTNLLDLSIFEIAAAIKQWMS